MKEIRRSEERVAAVRPVLLEHGEGLTRDLSPSGVYFETDEQFSAGGSIRFSLEFDNPGGKLALNCEGTIVRVENHEGKVGVAVRIVQSSLVPAAAVS